MKRSRLYCKACYALAAGVWLAAAHASAATLALWTFETNPPADLSNSATIGGIAADTGTGTASGSHTSAGTDWTTPAGNGSVNSLSANEYGVGDYFQFNTSTTGQTGIMFSFDQTRSGTGPDDFKVQADFGSGYVDVGAPYIVAQNTWAAATPVPSNFSFNLPATANNLATLSVRIVALEAGSAVAGTGRVDNVTVFNIPEPTSCGLALCSVAAIAGLRRRRR